MGVHREREPAKGKAYGTFSDDRPESTAPTTGDETRVPLLSNENGQVGHSVHCEGHHGHVDAISDDPSVRDNRTAEPDKPQSFLETLQLYPKAAAWSVFFSIGIIMAGFDPQLLGNFYAMPAFRREFGYRYQGDYIIAAPWQTALGMGAPLGQVVGACIATYPMEWYGRKKTFAVCNLLTTLIIFNQFFARSLRVLLVGEMCGGLVLGTYAVLAPAYASEVCPVALRGVLTSYINLCFVIGQLLANAVCDVTAQWTTHWAYSLPFALQWVWPAIVMIGIGFAPESPWWLVRMGRMDAAEQALRQLSSKGVDVKTILADIVQTDRLEGKMEAGSTYRDCFRGVNVRRTEIAVGVYSIQVISGIYLVGYSTYFFELAGLRTEQAFNMSVAFLGLGFIGTCISWALLGLFGRKTIYITGLTGLVTILLVIGILDCVPGYGPNSAIVWAQSILMLVWNFVYGMSVGPVCFVILCEVSATKLRTKTIAVATVIQAALGMTMMVLIPLMINPDQANLHGKVGLFFGGVGFVGLIWAYLRVPETQGRTYEELDIMFARGVKTSDFGSYRIQ